MSIFKSNERFGLLIDDIPDKKNKTKKENNSKTDTFNSFKSEKIRDDRFHFRPFDEKDRERHREKRNEVIKIQKEFEKREKERIEYESLKIENFPDLLVKPKEKDNLINTSSYIETLKKEKEKEKTIDVDLEKIKLGWVLLKLDKLTGKTIIKKNDNIEKSEDKSEEKLAIEVLNKLVELHEKRTNEYIDNYGYEEWEKMFKTKNWIEDEVYFEKMAYENYESEDDYDYDYDYEYDEYDEDNYEDYDKNY